MVEVLVLLVRLVVKMALWLEKLAQDLVLLLLMHDLLVFDGLQFTLEAGEMLCMAFYCNMRICCNTFGFLPLNANTLLLHLEYIGLNRGK